LLPAVVVEVLAPVVVEVLADLEQHQMFLFQLTLL
jgi:hypothetical protein